MNFVRNQVALARQDIQDALFNQLTMASPSMFNIEWLVDRAERGAWSGVWW